MWVFTVYLIYQESLRTAIQHSLLYGATSHVLSFSIISLKKNQQVHWQIPQQTLTSLACVLSVIFWFYKWPCCLISCSSSSPILSIEKVITFLRKVSVHIISVSL